MIIRFKLDAHRVNRLNSAGVHSLQELVKVLAAMDMVAKVELEEMSVLDKPTAAPAAKEK